MTGLSNLALNDSILLLQGAFEGLSLEVPTQKRVKIKQYATETERED